MYRFLSKCTDAHEFSDNRAILRMKNCRANLGFSKVALVDYFNLKDK